jgi:hypothetical protein
MFKSRAAAAIAIVLLAVAWFWTRAHVENVEKVSGVTSYGSSALATDAFLELAHPRILRSPILGQGELPALATFLLLAPASPVTEREATRLREFVTGGGTLLISFHDEAGWENLAKILVKFEIKSSPRKREGFENGKIVSLKPEKDSFLLRQRESYAFYGRLELPCKAPGIDCWFIEKSLGSGHVALFAGLPLFSNGLLGKEDNSRLAFRVAGGEGGGLGSPLVLDEFHHFFSDLGPMDLLRDPRFGLPLAGILFGTLLFFFLGQPEQAPERAETRTADRSFHASNERVVAGVLSRKNAASAALHQHRLWLKRSFPNRDLPPEKNKNPEKLIEEADRLVALHRKFILERRGES